MTGIDPVTLAVLRGAFEQIAEEMDTVLAASAISPVIADAWDRASGVFHPTTGEVVAQGSTGLPIFIIVMQHTVQEVLKSHPPATMRDGDVFIVNDPYRGGTHTMDVKFVRPYFRDGRLLALLANTGHWPDVGGMTPGGFTSTSTDIYQEGMRFPPVRLYDAGRLNEPLVEVMMANMRVSEDRRGDMAAQLNALDLGRQRLDDLFTRFDEGLVFAGIDELKARSEALMRSHIAAIPDGAYTFQDEMDGDGIDAGPLLIHLMMTVDGSNVTFDLSGSSPECRGPFNCPYSSTVSGLMIGIKHVFADVPINAGCFVPFRTIAPEGSMFNPRPPAPVSGTTTETAQRLACVTMGVLAQAMPGQVPAGPFGTGTNIGMGGDSPTRGRYATIFFFGGGYGGHAEGDGLTNGSTIIAASRNSSIEVLEHNVPILFTRHAVREGSAGDGRHRGGFGTDVAFHLRDGSAYLTLVADRGRTGPHGLLGGAAGQPAVHWMHAGGRSFQPDQLTKIDRLYLQAGDGVRLRTPGGGGFGHPQERSAAAREADAAGGYLGAGSQAPVTGREHAVTPSSGNRSRVLHRSLRAAPPVAAIGGHGAWIRTADGHEVLDASGGAAVSCLGHQHPRVLDAIRRQSEAMCYAHTGFFSSAPAEALAEELVGHEPGGLAHAYFVSSGSEAMEAAIKMARQYALETGEPARSNFIARRQSYHGNTLGALAASGNEARRAPYAPLLSRAFSHVSPAFAYHGQHVSETESDYTARLVAELDSEFHRLGPGTVAAFIAEPVVGATAGCVTAPAGYFRGIREVCDRHGALLILDEVMCGMGRTGTRHAWEQEGITPDIQTAAKGLGGGYQPIGAVLASTQIVAALQAGSGAFQHGHTYLAHPIACAAALAVQQCIRDENLLAAVNTQGELLRHLLTDRFSDHPHVGQVRGRGLFWAVELVADRETKAPFDPDKRLHARVKSAALARGLGCYPSGGTVDGIRGDHVLLAPPYTIREDEVRLIVDRLQQAIDVAIRPL